MQPRRAVQETFVGRFAPSPTGPLHFGSIIAAVASYLHIRKRQGVWLLRIDDLDTRRNQPGATDHILRTLETMGLFWDGEVVFQQRRHALYEEALASLSQQGLIYPCTCSRRKTHGQPYPGTCRNGPDKNKTSSAMRIITDQRQSCFIDNIQGPQTQNINADVGDFILKRSDGLFAYHLATVVDDHEQGITEIIRGSDLLDSTPQQIYLQEMLGYRRPQYWHHGIALNRNGTKISKQNHAPAINDREASRILLLALEFLGQAPDWSLGRERCQTILDWAVRNWRSEAVPRTDAVPNQTY